MFVSTNAIFLKDDYIINHKPKGRIDLREIEGEPSVPPVVDNNVTQENTNLHSFLHRYLVEVGG